MPAFCYKTNLKAKEYRAGNYPEKIRECLSDALTQHIAIYGIEDQADIESLSYFCDLTSYSIEATIINHVTGVESVIDENFQSAMYVGEDLRYLSFPDPIKEAIRHSIRLYALQRSEEVEWWLKDGLSFDQLEELADNVGYFIHIQTNANGRSNEAGA